MENKKKIKLTIFAIVTALAVVLAFIEPFQGLERKGMIFLGIFIWWIMMMIVELIPSYASCIIAIVIAIATGCGTTEQGMSAFGGSTVWLLIGSFGLATGLANSGLLNRLSVNIMRLFPGTYRGQILGLSLACLIVAPCIPSFTAKSAIMVPLAGTVADKMGYEKNSKGALGIFHIANVFCNAAGSIFLTGSVPVTIMLATAGASFNWFGWLKVSIVWGLVLIASTILYALIACKPEENRKIEKSELADMAKALGPISKKEIFALIILVLIVGLWITESMHGIPTWAVAVAGWVLLIVFNLFSMADLMTKIAWPVVLQIGGILGTITLLGTTGVSAWLGSLVAPVVNVVSGNPFLLVAAVSILSTLLMCAMIQAPVCCALFVPLLAASPISPVIISFVAGQSAYAYILPFQNPVVLASEGLYNGRLDHKTIVPSAWAYVVCHLVALLVSVPYWSMIGMMG